MTYKISLEHNPNPTDIDVLKNGILENGPDKGKDENFERFAFLIRDDKNHILGGVDGEIWRGCLHIQHLWVDEVIRGEGYGAKLMLSAENLGSEKGCTFAAANTTDKVVVSFYKKLGYALEFERHGYLKNSVLYFMRRDLPTKHQTGK